MPKNKRQCSTGASVDNFRSIYIPSKGSHPQPAVFFHIICEPFALQSTNLTPLVVIIRPLNGTNFVKKNVQGVHVIIPAIRIY